MPKYCVIATHGYTHTFENDWSDSTNPSYIGDICLGEVEASTPEEAIHKIIPKNDNIYAEDFCVYEVKDGTEHRGSACFGYLVNDGKIVIPYKDFEDYSCYSLLVSAKDFIDNESISAPGIIIDLKNTKITVAEFNKLVDVEDETFPSKLPNYWWKEYIVDFINPATSEIKSAIQRWEMAKV